MADIRVGTKRDQILTLKLTQAEHDALKQLAEQHHRRPGDQLRHLLAEAIKAGGPDAG